MRKLLVILVVLSIFIWLPAFATNYYAPETGFYTSNDNVKYFNQGDNMGGSGWALIPMPSAGGAGGNAYSKSKAKATATATANPVINNTINVGPESPIEPASPISYSTPVSMTVENTRSAPNAPNLSGSPEINFLSGGMEDVTDKLPKVAMWGIGRFNMKDDTVLRVVDEGTSRFISLYNTMIDMGAKFKNTDTSKLRCQVVRADSSKTRGVNINPGGSASGYASNTGLSGVTGFGFFGGRGTVDYIYTIVIVKVQ